jgi:hypothetical protein
MTQIKRVASLTNEFTSFDDVGFLEPPHHHDLLDLLQSTTPVPEIINAIQSDLRDALQAVIMSTSIMFASLKRLRLCQADLQLARTSKQETENLLVESKQQNIRQCCEAPPDPVLFNSAMRLRAEWLYFSEEAKPDWRHKALAVDTLLTDTNESSKGGKVGTGEIIQVWWHALQNLVAAWITEASQLKASFDSGLETTVVAQNN